MPPVLQPSPPAKLPVHGFVLAGGRSSRMGTDKALLPFHGAPMVKIALGKLHSFCAAVSIAGNRDDLRCFAPVVHESRLDTGPGAGIEAALLASTQPWALLLPVDVPLVPAGLLHGWAATVLFAPDKSGSSLLVAGNRQPAFCLLHRRCLPSITSALNAGERRLGRLFAQIEHDFGGDAFYWADAAVFAPADPGLPLWFSNVNTPEELASLLQRAHPADPTH